MHSTRHRLVLSAIFVSFMAAIIIVKPVRAQATGPNTPATEDQSAYTGTLALKQEPELGCNYTGDPAGGQVKLIVSGAGAAAIFEGQDEGIRQSLSCPTGWSGDLKWKGSYQGSVNGSYDGGGTVDEITMAGFMKYRFEYEYVNCSSSSRDVTCPDKWEEEDLIPVVMYGKFADDAQTRVTAGSVIDQFNRRWGFWGVEISEHPVVASVERIVDQVRVNDRAIAEAQLRANDVITLRPLTSNGPLPKARITCTVGEGSGQSADFEYVGSPILLNLVNPDDWDFSPQIVADWESVCSLAPEPGTLFQEAPFVQTLTTGAVMISVQDADFPSIFQTGTALVTTTGANTFVLAYSADTAVTLIGAFDGPLELSPLGDGAEPLRVESGEMAIVDENGITATVKLTRTFLPIATRN